jgi:hypothetical protein
LETGDKFSEIGREDTIRIKEEVSVMEAGNFLNISVIINWSARAPC